MALTLPDESALSSFSEEQLRLELACALYSTRGISRGLPAKLAGMELEAFESSLYARSVSNGQRLPTSRFSSNPSRLVRRRGYLWQALS